MIWKPLVFIEIYFSKKDDVAMVRSPWRPLLYKIVFLVGEEDLSTFVPIAVTGEI